MQQVETMKGCLVLRYLPKSFPVSFSGLSRFQGQSINLQSAASHFPHPESRLKVRYLVLSLDLLILCDNCSYISSF